MNQEPTTPQGPSVLPQASSPPGPSPTNNSAPFHKRVNIFAGKEKVELISLIVVILLAAGGAFAYGRHSKAPANSLQPKTSKPATAKPAPPAATGLPSAQFLSGNTYLDTAKALPDLGFFTNTDFIAGTDASNGQPVVKQSDIHYYQIGTTKDGKQIIAFYAPAGLGSFEGYALGDGSKYSLLLQMDTSLGSSNPDALKNLKSDVVLDKTTKLTDITFPLNTVVNGQKLVSDNFTSKTTPLDLSDNEIIFMAGGLPTIRGTYFDQSPSSPVKIGGSGNLDFYKVNVQDSATFFVQEIYGAYKGLFSVPYHLNGEIAGTTNNIAVKWTSGANNNSSYFSGGQGCGTRGYIVAKNIDPKALIQVGKTPLGQAVYQLPTSNPLVQEVYNKDYSGGSSLDDKSLKNLTISQFSADHAYFLAQNGFNEYVLFQRNDMFLRGGCAKPVIYLYPQAKQQVSVKVGAQVVNSLPNYSNGWDNVMAYPDGSLAYRGKVYSNLFWDGYGDGAYPIINTGVIVKTQDAVSSVKQQLASQGISSQEASDFLAYWQPKLEGITQPYVRLSWLNTAQMNQLAPLDISPKPQTLIRIFLDFEPVNTPYPIKPQSFNAIQRKGFTVVEWGGLARDGLNN